MTDEQKAAHVADLKTRGWTDREAAAIVAADADAIWALTGPPAPRPTCGTCAMWEPPTLSNLTTGHEDSGECRLMPAVNHKFRYQWCGQHPDMPKWIAEDWRKVKRNA